MSRSYALRVIVTLVISFTTSALCPPIVCRAAENEYISIPEPPPFRSAKKEDGSPHLITVDNLKNAFLEQSPAIKTFIHSYKLKGAAIIVPEAAWLKDMLAAYQQLHHSLGTRPKQDTWDCENYSSLLNAITTVKIWQMGYVDKHIGLGWLRVNAHTSWAGIPAEMHSLMFTYTHGGIYIFEPQNGQYITLEKYPNKAFIEEVYLF